MRKNLLTFALALFALVATSGFVRAADNPDSFTLVFVPDPQVTVQEHAAGFLATMKWVAGHNPSYVFFAGDITNANTEDEWIVAEAGVSLLKGPYAMQYGNHDAFLRETTNFNRHFPADSFQDWLVAAFEGKTDNTLHFFSAGGYDLAILALEPGPRDIVLDWANKVVAAYPERTFIVLTHYFLHNDGTLHGSKPGHLWSPEANGLSSAPGAANDGPGIWEKFVKKHANIALVLSGHIPGTARTTLAGEHGNTVHAILADFQDEPLGGPFVRVLRFYPGEGRIEVKTYSPYYDAHKIDSRNQFELRDVEFLTVNPSS